MSWEELRVILNEIAEDDNQKTFLDDQAIAFVDGAFPVHLSQSRVDGELILLPMRVAEDKKD